MLAIRLLLTYVVVFVGIEVSNQSHPQRSIFLQMVWMVFFLILVISGLPGMQGRSDGPERDRREPDLW